MTPPSSAPLSERMLLLMLACVQFTHILDFMIMMPLGPQLIRLLQLNTHQFSFLLSSYTLTAAVSGLLAATYVDRFDRRKLLLGLYALFIVATLCCGLASGFVSLLIARALAGAFGGVLGSLITTIVADVVPFTRRGQAMGIVMTAFSVSTVAGVPLGLFLSSHVAALGWRAPFFFIVLVSLINMGIAYRVLPSLTSHLGKPRSGGVLAQLWAVAREPEHLKAFVFVALMILSGFTVIPFVALYMTTNVGVAENMIPAMYLCGGVATLFTARAIGKWADQRGKPQVFRWVALSAIVPILTTTHMVPLPLWLVLINSTFFFVLVSGRWIPGMAMVSESAALQVRGSFMSLVSSVQMASSGLAALLSGLIISRAHDGKIMHYNIAGYIAVAAGLTAVWMVQRLRVTQAAPAPAAGEALKA